MNQPTRSFDKSTWRLLITQPATGAWNMAVDEALLESVFKGDSLPVLRLYAWDPPCLSIGYAQAIADIDLPALNARGWHLVRRPTGGRAILHTDELTYAVIGPLSEPRLRGSVLDCYQRISRTLLSALTKLQIPAIHQEIPSEKINPSSLNPVCFDLPSNYEITVNGKKLIGSAQARRKEGVIQHGTFPLYGDLTRILYALRFSDEDMRQLAAQKLLQRATSAEMVLGASPQWLTAARAFIEAFEEILNLEFVENDLTESELRLAETFVSGKYAHPVWTERV